MSNPDSSIATYDDAIMPLDELNPAHYNPRVDLQPGDPEYESIKASILTFGYKDPMVWNKRTGRLVGGHQRLKILKQLGFTRAKVVVCDLEEDDEIQLNVALNNATGRNDELKLMEILSRLKKSGHDLKACGFDADKLRALARHASFKLPAREDPFDLDGALLEIDEPITKRGDLIILGEHRLLCGDSTKREEVELLMDGQKAAMIHTDPPYNVAYGSNRPMNRNRTRAIVAGDENTTIANDNMKAPEWEAFCKALYAIYKDICTGDIYQWGASGPDGMRSRLWLVEAGCHWSATIVWAKDSIVISPANYLRQYEPCFYGWFDRSSFNLKHLEGMSRSEVSEVWRARKPTRSELHPTMKPVELCARAVSSSSLPGDIVLDLFGGSGSTMIACEQLSRRCCMMEIEPYYCDVIVRRWEALTGRRAVRPHG